MAENEFYGDLRVNDGKAIFAPGVNANDGVVKQQLDSSQSFALSRANHTGTQTASTISDLQAVIAAAIQQVVGAAPAALDTLQEIAAQLQSDESAAGAIAQRLSTAEGNISSLQTQAATVNGFMKVVGDGTATGFDVDHNLNSDTIFAEVWQATGTKQRVYPVLTKPSVNRLRVDFGNTVIPVNSMQVLIQRVRTA